MKTKDFKNKDYEAPVAEVLEVELKGLLCESFDGANAGEFDEEEW